MRKRYIQINGELVEVTPDYKAPQRFAPDIMPDIQPYKSMIDGSMITSRSKHRAHLKAHGMIEVGNEKLEHRPSTRPDSLRKMLVDVTNSKLR